MRCAAVGFGRRVFITWRRAGGQVVMEEELGAGAGAGAGGGGREGDGDGDGG